MCLGKISFVSQGLSTWGARFSGMKLGFDPAMAPVIPKNCCPWGPRWPNEPKLPAAPLTPAVYDEGPRAGGCGAVAVAEDGGCKETIFDEFCRMSS